MTSEVALGRAGALLTIDLDAIAGNWRRLQALGGPAECGAVLKADAYGLGAAPVGRALFAAGARSFFVAHLEEGIALRAALTSSRRLSRLAGEVGRPQDDRVRAGPGLEEEPSPGAANASPTSPASGRGNTEPAPRIIVLNGLLPGLAADYTAHDLIPALNDPGEIAAWAGHARTLGSALPGFVHLDSGMNRLGLMPEDQERLAADLSVLDGIGPITWMTHLACAEETQSPMSRAQLDRFRRAVTPLPQAPVSIANSSGIFLGSDFHGDLTRPGAALYGINPTPGRPNPMADVVRLEARILQIRRVDTPMTVGYGAAHRVEGPARLATIAVGYADGVPRAASGRGAVRIAGFTAPITGRISMDLITVDVTHIPEPLVTPGALAEIIGPELPPDQLGESAGTIGYEILTRLGRRYARRYLGGAE
ncbi:alanine racemase [Inquilinus ginsengisoli]|uniref:alanine racemase n=1 Tax=Inquilinus ginsengisoli TaxID=363840 RepID=UPI003D25060F